ncbi:hypothetical protein FRC11_011294 [Ceratobasidium sp. 423]|nr:hypothetical protein FRC11_011294 [Ceratobasidium sp. 423]
MAGRGESEYVLALHDFVPVNGNTTCLSFRAGQIIHVLNRDSTGWWDGELEGRRGWFPSNYVKASKRKPRESVSSESGSEAEACPRVMVSLYHALLVLNTSVHASRVSHYQPSTACVISSVRTVLTATDCLHKTAPALARFPHLARARSDVLQELGRLVAVSKKASAPDVPDAERAWLAESMLRYGDAVFACCKRYVEVAVSCGVHVAGRPNVQPQHHSNELAPRLTSASVSSLSSVSSAPASPEIVPSGHVPSAQLLSALRTTHDHLLSIIAAFIGHVHSHSRASHASSKGHLIKMTRETVDKVRQVLTIVCAVCDHPAVVGPERVALSAAKDALHGATSVLVEAVKRMLAPGSLNREEEEKALAVQAATGTLRAGGDCVTAVRSCLTRRGYEPNDMLVFDVPPPPPSVSDQTRSMRSASPSGSEPESAGSYRRDAVYGSLDSEAGPSNHGTVRAMRASVAARPRASISISRTGWPQASGGRSGMSPTAVNRRRPSAGESVRRASEEEWRRAAEYTRAPEAVSSSSEEEPRRSNESMRSIRSARHPRAQRRPTVTEQPQTFVQPVPEPKYEPGNESIGVRPEHEPMKVVLLATPVQDVPDELERHEMSRDARLDAPIPEVEEAPRDVTPHSTTEDALPTQPTNTYSPRHIPLPDDAQSIEGDAVHAEAPVVVSTTTSPARSFERSPRFRHESSTPSTLEFKRSSQFTAGSLSLFESARTSEDTAATTIIPEEGTDHPTDNRLGLNGFSNEDDDVDAESLMIEPDVVSGLVASEDDDQAFDEDGLDRTPLPPPQTFEPPEEESGEEGFRDDEDIKHRNDKSLPAIPPPISISQTVDLLAIQTIDPRDVVYHPDGHLMGATLDVLVEKMTSHDRTPDPKFAATFFLSFRLFTTPLELVEVLHRRWNMSPPVDTFSQEEYETWCRARLDPVRWRVYNFIKAWLDLHWQPAVDSVALAPLQEFVSATASNMHPPTVQRVVDLLTQRQPESESQLATSRPMDRARSAERTRTKAAGSAPTPVMSKSLFALLKSGAYGSVNVVDFDALELARQFSILESHLYCKILPEEILDVGLPSSAGERRNSIRAMSTLSTAITGWVTEIILDEQDTKKRTGLLKLFIKVADHCDDLNNFATLRSILAALDSSTISRLSKTWMGLSAKNKARLENLRKLTDHTRNHYEYRARLRSIRGQAVPFLGLYLTDVTFCREGNPDKRVSPYDPTRTLLNFDKYRRLAAIAEDVQRFQTPYNLIEIPEVQKYLEYAFEKVKKSGNDLHDLYRRSLLVEPRQPTDSLETKTNSIKSSELFGWASRDKS